MGIGVGIFLAAVGAILTFAVSVTATGFNIHTIGIILMIVGIAGILLDLVLFMPRRRRTTVVTDNRVADPAVTRTTQTY
jgi:beta-lactamase regulating signal transducer with metallopeptidase domain